MYLEVVIETNPDAVGIAAGLDEERQQGKVRGSLHGVPVLVKDVSQSMVKFFYLDLTRTLRRKTGCKRHVAHGPS